MSEERALLIQTVRDLVGKHAGPEAVRAAMASPKGYDERLWQLLCEQVGAAALVVPEDLGGAGGVLADAAAVLTELGRNLVPTPLLGSTLAELALLAGQPVDADAREKLEALTAGESIGAVVFDPEYVVNGDIADVVIGADSRVLTRWVDFEATAQPTMDATRPLAKLRAIQTTALGADPGLGDLARLLVAAEAVGAATRCLELTVEYTKERVQFGRPIGSFQALKHRMADLYVLVQTAGAVVDSCLDDPSAESAALAFVTATEAFSAAAAEAIQLHGGIAITAECDIQLYFKRAHANSQLFGTVGAALAQLEPVALTTA